MKANKTRRKGLLQGLNRSEVDCLCEVVLNAVAGCGKDRLSPSCVKRCQRHKKRIRTLAFNHRLSWKKRRDLLTNQAGSGWFIPLLSAVVSSLLAG